MYMKKVLSILLVITVVLSIIPTILADERPVTIKINDNVASMRHGVPYLNSDQRVMVPLAFVASSLGCQVKWYTGDTVAIQNAEVRMIFTVGEYVARITNLEANATRLAVSDARPVWKGQEVMLPLRFTFEGLGARVDWDGDIKQANIALAGNFNGISQSNRVYMLGKPEKEPYNMRDPLEIEYLDITEEEVASSPVLKALSQLPNCTSVSRRVSDTTRLHKYRFVFQEVNHRDGNNLTPVFYFDLNSDFSAFSFWVERNNPFTLELLRSTLAILYKNDVTAQNAIYKQIVDQRTDLTPNLNTSNYRYRFTTARSEGTNWGGEAFNVMGTVFRIR